MQRITVEEASKQLNMTPLTVRILMQQEKLPIGYFQKRDGCERGYYIIFKELVDGYKDRIEHGSM